MTLLQIDVRVKELLSEWGFSDDFSTGMRDVTDFIIVFAIIVLSYYLIKYVVVGIARRLSCRSSTTWDDPSGADLRRIGISGQD